MGCAAMLLSPIFAFGALVLANTSRDSATTVSVVWSWVLLFLAVVTFTFGCVVWVRNR